MYIPSSTYRIQFNKDFTFRDLKKQLGYLDSLGAGCIYSSPIFKAVPGSGHGYDVTDPHKFNPEIGSLEDFEGLVRVASDKNIGWLQDIVPNHMAFDSRNPWVADVLESGPDSPFYSFFDIDWEFHNQALKGKVMLPFLGEPFEKCLQSGELVIWYTRKRLFVTYYDNRYPMCLKSYVPLLEEMQKASEKWEMPHEDIEAIRLLIQKIRNFGNTISIEEKDEFRTQLTNALKSKDFEKLLRFALDSVNRDPERVRAILSEQYYSLTYYKATEQEINFRRFFTINGLICINMQDERIFKYYHRFIKSLVRQGLINGLRIDHVDGLANPGTYLKRLRSLVGEDTYIVVEKILEEEEDIPASWPIQGSSGYEFLAVLNRLFTDSEGWRNMEEVYQEIVPEIPPFGRLLPERKYFMLKQRMHGELENLYRLLINLKLIEGEQEKIKEALARLMSAFPVYRIYSDSLPLEAEESDWISEAFARVEDRFPKLKEPLDELRPIFASDLSGDKSFDGRRMNFLQRWQQFTGPLAAKGGEDTTFYNFHRLISRNEVGDSPSAGSISVPVFHKAMVERNKLYPHAMNGTSTHDTKRGEDSRMRLNVLTEISDQWADSVLMWKKLNSSFKGEGGPDANDEYFLYQVLVGLWPMNGKFKNSHLKRLKAYLSKAVREAKVHTSWSNPNNEYEENFLAFADNILTERSEFVSSFNDFLKPLIRAGAINSLAQVVIKHTAPGIPDIYQGCEGWDLSLVDPDNRRPVDYEDRKKSLNKIKKSFSQKPVDLLNKLTSRYSDGDVKLFVTWRMLQLRKRNHKFFRRANYIPLEVDEDEEIIGYIRQSSKKWLLVICPIKNHKNLVSSDSLKLRMEVEDTVDLPEKAPSGWVDLFTGKHYDTLPSLRELFHHFPVVCLHSSNFKF
ncbi:malto-oligosyltrehalose synthase [Roseivirga sp. BDSF3-8]|uniref:malto-oligosyltrehalose synthase n=1 Tax=Roseivirga sp. BDSF3-8 TaxID=3241598 RepID=UPI00353243AE